MSWFSRIACAAVVGGALLACGCESNNTQPTTQPNQNSMNSSAANNGSSPTGNETAPRNRDITNGTFGQPVP